MSPPKKRIRGWKEIASYIDASERTVKRWEKTRGLPVRRVAGTSRDAVFADCSDLDAWLRSSVACNEQPLTPGAEAPGEAAVRTRGASAKLRPWLLPAGIALVLVTVAIARLSLSSPGNGQVAPRAAEALTSVPGAEGTAAPHSQDPVLLRVKAGSSSNTLAVPKGDCAEVAFSRGPHVKLCPHVTGNRLWLHVFDESQEASAEKITVELEPNTEVRVTKKHTFVIEWVVRTGVSQPRAQRGATYRR